MSDTLPMPLGLTELLLAEGPQMWHEFALGLDFADPKGTIDLLLAADAVTSRADCDRATAALILAKAMAAGFHLGQCPKGFVEEAALAFATRLAGMLASESYTTSRFALPAPQRKLVAARLGALGLPPLRHGRVTHRPRLGFAGWRPVRHPATAQPA